MAELLLDSDIRLWVFLPIVVITFLVGIIRHYVTILLSTEKKVELQQISDRYLLSLMLIPLYYYSPDDGRPQILLGVGKKRKSGMREC